jgi:ABC-2 type transport system permease protein
VAGVTVVNSRGQFSAIARVRWHMFVHSLRTRRGAMELASRIFVTIFFGFGGLAGAMGLASGAYYFVSQARAPWLPVLYWPVFVFWQLFPVMATAFSENLDSSTLLRFPMTYRSYFLVRILYGSLDVSTGLGLLWLLGITAGVALAKIALLPFALLVAVAFAAANISLARLTFAWVERWLAQRKTREIFGVLVLLFALGGQLIGPVLGRYGRKSAPGATRIAQQLAPEQSILPPGAAGAALANLTSARSAAALGYVLLLCAYSALFLFLLHLRLHKQYWGENLNEAAARQTATVAQPLVRPAWRLPGLRAPIAAVLQKELLYLLRSGPMLFTLVVPAFMLLIFRLGPAGSRETGGFLMRAPNLTFPIGAAYCLLLLTNLIYNNFGADGPGLQAFLASPVRFREIVLAKNLAHSAVLIFEMIMVWIAVSLLFKAPSFDIKIATLTGIAFAAPVNFLAGNLLSLYSPKKVDYGVLGRQRASQTGVLASFGIQIAILAVAAAIVFLARMMGSYWTATLAFLILAAVAWTAYILVLNSIDGIAFRQREALLSELCRA